MTQAYTDWLKRPEAERNDEAATVVMGWHSGLLGGRAVWANEKNAVQEYQANWSPCTDRNATDMLLAATLCLREGGVYERFKLKCAEGYEQWIGLDATLVNGWMLLNAPASLLTWAAIEACRGGEA